MSQPAQRARVLIVEDNPINRELADYLLRSFGFETFRAVDGAIGLDIAARERPDLVLCDIQMPVLDGLEFARRMRADPELRTIPLIAVTAFAMVGDSDRILAQGFDAYVAKPIEPTELLGVVDSLLPPPLRSCAAGPEEVVAPPPAAPSRRRRILVLDDVAFNRELKRDLLEPHGFDVALAATVDEALAEAHREMPDLILSDVGVGPGGVGGFDFIRRVKADASLRNVPFLFMTSTHWDLETRRAGMALGAVRYINRPIEPVPLLREIEACLACPAGAAPTGGSDHHAAATDPADPSRRGHST